MDFIGSGEKLPKDPAYGQYFFNTGTNELLVFTGGRQKWTPLDTINYQPQIIHDTRWQCEYCGNKNHQDHETCPSCAAHKP
jgi:hypothetical protein